MNKIELIKEVLEILKDMDNADNVIHNLDAKAIAEKMKIVDIIPIYEDTTNGDIVKTPFSNCCDDTKAIIKDDVEDYEVHSVHIWGAMTINRYDEDWWNAKYKREGEEF